MNLKTIDYKYYIAKCIMRFCKFHDRADDVEIFISIILGAIVAIGRTMYLMTELNWNFVSAITNGIINGTMFGISIIILIYVGWEILNGIDGLKKWSVKYLENKGYDLQESKRNSRY